MNLDWKEIYSIANNSTFEEFLKYVKVFDKEKELPAVQKFVSYMEKYEKQVLPSLLNDTHAKVTPANFSQIVINEVKKSDKLLEAFVNNPSSMFASILAGAEIGLVPSDLLGEFYLIPRNIRQDNGSYKMTVTPLIGYKGLHKILLRGGEIENIEAHIVYEGEDFNVSLGTNPKLEHNPNFTVPRSADKITHAYAVAHYKSGRCQFQVLTRAEITAISNMSKYNNKLYFNDKENPNRWMEKKCCLIQLAKMLDKDYYGTKAIELDNRLEGGATLTLDEQDKVRLIEGAAVKPSRYRNIYGSLKSLPSQEENTTVE
jgi:phage RecT family recombinase